MDAGARPTVAVFVLPVQARHVRLLSGEAATTAPGTGRVGMQPVHARQLVADASNRVLNTLGKGSGNRLMTPVKLRAAAMSEADWITLDVYLPGMDGWAVLDRLKHHPNTRHIPVHIISGIRERQQGLKAGAMAYLETPVTKDAL